MAEAIVSIIGLIVSLLTVIPNCYKFIKNYMKSKRKDTTKVSKRKEHMNKAIMAIITKPKYMFYPHKNIHKIEGYYEREEYSEILDKYRRVDDFIWKLDDIEAWAKDNDYKVGHDFTIEPEKYHHNSY